MTAVLKYKKKDGQKTIKSICLTKTSEPTVKILLLAFLSNLDVLLMSDAFLRQSKEKEDNLALGNQRKHSPKASVPFYR